MIEITKEKDGIYEVFNGIIGLKFYKNGKNRGKYEIKFKKDEFTKYIIKDCYSVINYYSDNKESLIEIASNNFLFKNRIEKIDDEIGHGLKIIFTPVIPENQEVSFKIQFKIYEIKEFILVKIIDINDNNQNQLAVHSISPLTIRNSALWLSGGDNPSNLQNITWFKNGWQSWSPCELFFGKQKDTQGSPTQILKMIYDNQDYKINGRFYSEYCTVITDLNSRNSVILGFVSLINQFTRIILDYDNFTQVKLLTAFGCMDSVKFNKSEIDSSEELFICFKIANMGYYGLIDYSKIVSLNYKRSQTKQIPIGWCSWYYYFTNITQEQMIKNVVFFKTHRDLPIDFIQLDDGYFTKIGDFSNINEKFPNGLPWLFRYIKKLGFKGGIWTAPFIAIRRSNFFRNNRNWFLTKSKKLLPVLFNWKSFEYSLDISKKEVLNYLNQYFTNLLEALKTTSSDQKEHLIEFFKIDFLHAATPHGAEYADPIFTRAQLLHNAIKTIREAITDDSFLLGCGAPLGPCVGVVDAMRISCDTAPLWDAGYVEKFENGRGLSEISLKAALLNTLYRSFMNKYFWINDPDCLMIRRSHTELNIDEIKLQMTIFGLSGGQILISDDMSKLSEGEINDAKLLIPIYNSKKYDPIVVDAFISELPSIYMLETSEIIGKRYLVSIINWNDHVLSKKLRILDIIPSISEKDSRFYVYDFWNEKYLGEFKNNEVIELQDIKPHSCVYLNIIPGNKKSEKIPVLLSSNLHITQGCCEIKLFEFNNHMNQLTINLELKGTRKGFLLLKLPENQKINKSNFKYINIDSKENFWKVFVQFKDFLVLNIDLD